VRAADPTGSNLKKPEVEDGDATPSPGVTPTDVVAHRIRQAD
jgi:hypothetical protein